MCNWYSITRSRTEVRRWFKLPDNRTSMFAPLDAIFPGYVAPVIRQASDGERELATMSCGFLLLMGGMAPRRVANVRDDKILSSPFWKGSFHDRRCLVPVSSYCERNGQSPATWYWFTLTGDHPRPLFAFPNIWQQYTGPIKKDGLNVTQDVYAFMTTEPNPLTARTNHADARAAVDQRAVRDLAQGHPERSVCLGAVVPGRGDAHRGQG